MTVADGWYMTDFMLASMEAACQYLLVPRLGEDPSSRNFDRVPVFKPGEVMYVAFSGMKRSELQILEALRMKFKSLGDRAHSDPVRMAEWGPEPEKGCGRMDRSGPAVEAISPFGDGQGPFGRAVGTPRVG